MQTFDLEEEEKNLINQGHHLILVTTKCQVTWDTATYSSLNKQTA